MQAQDSSPLYVETPCHQFECILEGSAENAQGYRPCFNGCI